jgi:hypothetical protein
VKLINMSQHASARALVIGVALAGGSAAGCGGGGDDEPISYTPVSAMNDGGLYTLQLGALKLAIDGTRGARITEWSLRGTNVLVTREQNGSYGSTYWPSPQSSWCAAGAACWPPVAAIDTQAYTGDIDAQTNIIRLTSAAGSIDGFAGSAVTLTKQLVPVPDSGAVDVTYTLANTSPSVAVEVAPWLISRVATGGLTFFGQGNGAVTYAPDSDPAFAVSAAAGDLWYESAPVGHNSKAFADGTGWLAHVTPDRLLTVLAHPDIQPADAAPGEAEIEVFTNGDYVEIESQGPLTAVAAGETLTWTVRWKLRRLAAGTPVAAGSAELASFAAATLAE